MSNLRVPREFCRLPATPSALCWPTIAIARSATSIAFWLKAGPAAGDESLES
jgi:hypothetical protein